MLDVVVTVQLMYLEGQGNSEENTGATADPKSQKKEQPSAGGLHNKDLGQQISCWDTKTDLHLIRQAAHFSSSQTMQINVVLHVKNNN